MMRGTHVVRSPNPQSVEVEVCPFFSFPPMVTFPFFDIFVHGRSGYGLGDGV